MKNLLFGSLQLTKYGETKWESVICGIMSTLLIIILSCEMNWFDKVTWLYNKIQDARYTSLNLIYNYYSTTFTWHSSFSLVYKLIKYCSVIFPNLDFWPLLNFTPTLVSFWFSLPIFKVHLTKCYIPWVSFVSWSSGINSWLWRQFFTLTDRLVQFFSQLSTVTEPPSFILQ